MDRAVFDWIPYLIAGIGGLFIFIRIGYALFGGSSSKTKVKIKKDKTIPSLKVDVFMSNHSFNPFFENTPYNFKTFIKCGYPFLVIFAVTIALCTVLLFVFQKNDFKFLYYLTLIAKYYIYLSFGVYLVTILLWIINLSFYPAFRYLAKGESFLYRYPEKNLIAYQKSIDLVPSATAYRGIIRIKTLDLQRHKMSEYPLSKVREIERLYDVALKLPNFNDYAKRAYFKRRYLYDFDSAIEDAKKAVEIGADAIMASIHGGRQLDGSISAFEQLADIVDAVGDKIDVICDGGIRRGTHVLKALSVGAKACSGGRWYLYALAAGGQPGVEKAISNMKNEIERDMKLMGITKLSQLSRKNIKFR